MAKIKNFTLGGKLQGSAAEKIKEINKINDKTDEYDLRYVPYEKIVRNPENRIANKDIDELAESIMAVGLLDALRATELEDGTFMLIAGERRWRAIGKIREANPDLFKTVPVIVENKETDELKQALTLMDSNEQRVNLEPAEKRKNIELIEKLYQERKKNGENVDVNITKRIAKALHVSERQVQKISSVNKKLIPELQELFDQKTISLDTASAIAQIDEIYQRELVKSYESEGKLDKEDIEFYKNEDQRLKTENKDLKKELDELRDSYKKVIEEVKDREVKTEAEAEEQQKDVDRLNTEKEEKVNKLTQGVIPQRIHFVNNNPEAILDKAINRLSNAQCNIDQILANGIALDEIGKIRIKKILKELEKIVG